MPRGKYVRTDAIRQKTRATMLRTRPPVEEFSRLLGGLTAEHCREVLGLAFGDLEPSDLSLYEPFGDRQIDDVLRQAVRGGHVIYGEDD